MTTPAGVHNVVKGYKNVTTIKKLPVKKGNPNFQIKYMEPSGIDKMILDKKIKDMGL